MIYYITREKNQDIFDSIAEEKNIIVNKNLRSNLKLNLFVKKELRNMQGITHLALDIQAIKFAEVEELFSTIDSYHLINPESKVIIVAIGEEIESETIQELKRNQHGRYDMITRDNPVEEKIKEIFNKEDMKASEETVGGNFQEQAEVESLKKEQLNIIDADSVLKKGMEPVSKISEEPPLNLKNREEIRGMNTSGKVVRLKVENKEPIKQNLYDYLEESVIEWNCEDIMIGVAGVERKIGTTTAAFHIAEGLNELGAKVIYTEANRSKHLSKIATDYHFSLSVSEGCYSKDNINYFENADIQLGGNFIIIDVGVINRENIDRLRKFDELIILAGANPYELTALDSALKLLEKDKIDLILNYVPEGQKESFMKKFSTEDLDVYFMKYAPDLLDRGKNLDEFLNQLICRYKEDLKKIPNAVRK